MQSRVIALFVIIILAVFGARIDAEVMIITKVVFAMSLIILIVDTVHTVVSRHVTAKQQRTRQRKAHRHVVRVKRSLGKLS